MLSTSILVFGLGAAALVRASHEQYVNNPSWRNGPQEQVFAQSPEPDQPVLAALRVEPPVPVADEATPVMQDQIPSIGLPAVETDPEQMAAVTLAPQPEPQVAAIASPVETAPPTTEAPAPEPAEIQAAASAPTDTLTPADTIASIATTTPPPAVSATDVPRTATPALATRVSDLAAARVAALNELATTAGKASPAKADSATQESKPRAHKPKKRHRIVRRPPPQQVNQALDPFGQQQQTLATTAARTR
ncbi:hypothetical protein ACFQZO_01895 [Bradyrhizobium sp. GCM10027634]|uniref:hypothetical protein n=1 Tax=unclassified Bradyrhizobium TaxID=2631580 RepID=UPI0034605149